MRTRHTIVRSILGAATLSLLVAGQALAAEWEPGVELQSSDQTGDFAAPTGLVTSGTTASAFYGQIDNTAAYSNADIWVRRSTDAGDTWGAPALISRQGANYSSEDAVTAGMDNAVDVAWTELNRSLDSYQIEYRRSLNAGASYGDVVGISSRGRVRTPAIAHGPNDVVAIAWYNWEKRSAFIRVSQDGGATFAPRVVLWPQIEGLYYTALAIGDGVIYASYVYENALHMRRSFDGGATWSPDAVIITTRGLGQPSLTAEDSEAYIGFVHGRSGRAAAAFIRTLDSGDTWSTRVNLARPSACASRAVMLLRDGVIRAVFGRRASGVCYMRLFYVESQDGVTWSQRERVSPEEDGEIPSIGYVGRPLVLYYNYDVVTEATSILVRPRQ